MHLSALILSGMSCGKISKMELLGALEAKKLKKRKKAETILQDTGTLCKLIKKISVIAGNICEVGGYLSKLTSSHLLDFLSRTYFSRSSTA